jgi:hypothetical protein
MRPSLSLWLLVSSSLIGCRGTDGLICGEGTHEEDGSCVVDEEADTDTDTDTDVGTDTDTVPKTDTGTDTDTDTDTGTDTGTDTDTDTEPDTTLFSATEGIWHGRFWSIPEDTCNLGNIWWFDQDSVVLYEVTQDGDNFTFVTPQGVVWPCMRTEGTDDFSCEATSEFDFSEGWTLANGATVPAGLDAVLMLTAQATGTLTNDTTYAGSRSEWTGECVGADCSLVRGIAGISADPCTMVMDSYQINLIPPVDVLQYGDYIRDEFTWSDDGCNFTDNLDLPGFLEDTGTLNPLFDDGHYVGVEGLDIDDGVVYTCALDAHNSLNWTCDSEVLHTFDAPAPIEDAVVTLTLDVTSRTASHTRYWPDFEYHASCAGTGCSDLVDLWDIDKFPCTATGSSTSNLVVY